MVEKSSVYNHTSVNVLGNEIFCSTAANRLTTAPDHVSYLKMNRNTWDCDYMYGCQNPNHVLICNLNNT